MLESSRAAGRCSSHLSLTWACLCMLLLRLKASAISTRVLGVPVLSYLLSTKVGTIQSLAVAMATAVDSLGSCCNLEDIVQSGGGVFMRFEVLLDGKQRIECRQEDASLLAR